MKITSVRTSVKEDKILAIFKVEGQENNIFLTNKQVASATGIQTNFSVLKGSDLVVEYFKVDDELSNGVKCTKDNTLVKEYSFELSDSLSKIAMAASFGTSMF